MDGWEKFRSGKCDERFIGLSTLAGKYLSAQDLGQRCHPPLPPASVLLPCLYPDMNTFVLAMFSYFVIHTSHAYSWPRSQLRSG